MDDGLAYLADENLRLLGCLTLGRVLPLRRLALLAGELPFATNAGFIGDVDCTCRRDNGRE